MVEKQDPTQESSSNVLATLIGLGAALVGIVVVIVCLASLLSVNDHSIRDNGVETVGTPTGEYVEIRSATGSNNKTMTPKQYIIYEYTVDGRIYSVIGDRPHNTVEDVEAAIAEGKTVSVYYLPEDPYEANVEGD